MGIGRITVAAAALAALSAAPADAQEWPTRPLIMVVPFAAGGPADLLGRILGHRLSELLGQQVIIENAGGAGGVTGSVRVAKAAPDGYQFVMGTTGTHAQNQALYKNPPYHPIADFAPMGLIVVTRLVLIARNDLLANNFKEFADLFKENHDKMQFGSAGAGSGTHLGCVLLNAALGANVTHVPYRGSALAMADLQGGRIDYMCDVVSTALPQIEAKTVKAIAVLNRERAPVFPDLPSAQEQGLSNFEAPGWFAFFLPKATPAAIIGRLNKALSETLDTPLVRERLEALGMGIPPLERRSPEYLSRFVTGEIEKWSGPIKAANITLD
jgi:tripartite-type tricarboxylate transporter receptor subunit TctC